MTIKENISLSQYYKFPLTNSQNIAVDKINSFLSSNLNFFVLKGSAGTGKTFLISGLISYLSDLGIKCVLMAPTGRAAKVISNKTGHSAHTIHKTIYSMDKLKEYYEKNPEDTETYKFYFDLKPNDSNENVVYIVDESSMISNNYSSQEFFRFGSGFLLNDLIKFINFSSNMEHKVIFIGDPIQLPPIGSAKSLAMNLDFLETTYSISGMEYTIDEVVRQKKDSLILKNANKIRNAVQNNEFKTIALEKDGLDIIPINPDEILSKYLEVNNNKIMGDAIIIAYSNSSVADYNRIIRSHFYPDSSRIQKGDRVMIIRNNYSYEIDLMNGDFGTVDEVSDNVEIRSIPIIKYGKEEIIDLKFREVKLVFHEVNGKEHKIKSKILENILESNYRDIYSNEAKAMYIDFKLRNQDLKPGSEEFKRSIITDPYFNALFLKYGYAVTCHKSQGGEWNKVFIDFQSYCGILNESYFRWAYTAITRSKETLYVFNESFMRKYSISEINDFIAEISKDEKIDILDIQDFPYCKRYKFHKNGELASLDFFYDKNKNYTLTKPSMKGNSSDLEFFLTCSLNKRFGELVADS